MKYFLFAITVTILYSCNPLRNPDGGPCVYVTDTLPATVVAIQPHDSLHSEILFTVEKTPGKTDTLYYTKELNSPFATDEDLKKYGVEEGERYMYIRNEIKSGTCTPEIYSLQMEKFRK